MEHLFPDIADMTDLQLLSYLLTLAGTPMETARSAAHTLLDSYDSLATILTLPSSTLVGDPRLDENSGAFLALVGAMASRYVDRFHRSELVVTDKETVARLLAPHLQDSTVERVCAICLDRDFHLLGSSAVVTRGDTDSVALPIQRLLALALSSNAYGMILAHSHPDGIPQFSPADLATTHALRVKLEVLDISLLDHYIWANGPVSLYEQLHAPLLPPPLNRWDLSAMPLLSRLDPDAPQRKEHPPRTPRNPLFARLAGSSPSIVP